MPTNNNNLHEAQPKGEQAQCLRNASLPHAIGPQRGVFLDAGSSHLFSVGGIVVIEVFRIQFHLGTNREGVVVVIDFPEELRYAVGPFTY